MQRTQHPRSDYNSGDKELKQTNCIASLWLQWIIFWSKSQLGSSWSRWSSSSCTDSAYVFRGRQPIIWTDLQQHWRYNRWAGSASSRSPPPPPLLEAKSPSFEEKKETLALVLEEITFTARSRTGIEGEAMAVQQKSSLSLASNGWGSAWRFQVLDLNLWAGRPFFSWVLRPRLGSSCICLWRLSPFLPHSPLCQLRPWYLVLPLLFQCDD